MIYKRFISAAAAAQQPVHKRWWQTKTALAFHIAAIYFGLQYYVHCVVKEKIHERDEPKSSIHKAEQNIDVKQKEQAAVNSSPSVTNLDLNNILRFDSLAKFYDNKIKWDEFVMGLGLFRRQLLSNASGDILELSVGSGRNMKYYPSVDKIKSIQFVDVSRNMLIEAVKKYEYYKSSKFTKSEGFLSWIAGHGSDAKEIPVEFVQADASNLYHIPDNSVDTVVDSFGLCSVCPQDGVTGGDCVVRVLNEMARVCRKDGKILLLEHGKSNSSWVTSTLDSSAVEHFKKWGCWHSRSIEDLIKSSNLEVEYMSRWHFGTTYYIVCKPVK